MIDLPQLIDVVTRLGATGLLTVWLWMMLTDRLHTSKRVDEANARAEAAEKQRDEAIEIAREQVQATKDLTTANQAVVDLARGALSGRRSR